MAREKFGRGAAVVLNVVRERVQEYLHGPPLVRLTARGQEKSVVGIEDRGGGLRRASFTLTSVSRRDVARHVHCVKDVDDEP